MTILIDIETAPTSAFVWGMWKQNINHDMIIERGYIMCGTVKILGEDEIYYYDNRFENDYEVTANLIKWLDKADVVIAHNARKFDVPLIRARALVHNIKPPSPYKILDTLAVARKEFRFSRNTLKNLAEELKCSPKDTHKKFPGFLLWKECMKDNEDAWDEMKLYNIEDVLVLEEVYLKLRPWDSRHPNIAVDDDEELMRCPKCNSSNVSKRGFFTTNVGKYQRYKCNSCHGWSSDRRGVSTVEKRKSLLTAR